MVKLILYMDPLSVPSMSVIFLAKYIGVELEYKKINLLKRENLTPEFIKLNPQHTVPTLIDGADIIYDSHAICAYLVGKYAKDDKLYPKDLVKRALVDARLHFDSCDLFSRLRSLYVPILYCGAVDLQKEAVSCLLESWLTLERFLKEHHYLCGDNMTIADLCCVATITALGDNVPIDEKKYPKLSGWLKRMCDLPFYSDDCAEGLMKLIREKLAENRAALGQK